MKEILQKKNGTRVEQNENVTLRLFKNVKIKSRSRRELINF